MIEAELKARVREPVALRERLSRLAAGEQSIYRDAYYDCRGGDRAASGRELRLRTIEAAGERRFVLTYKEPSVDGASGSKPEHESEVSNPAAMDVLLRGLGLGVVVAFEKHCTNYRFRVDSREMTATVVTVRELDGVFVELETMTDADGVGAALADVRSVLLRLGIEDGDFTTEQYTDAVLESRRGQR